jgi:hypothetical protein
MIIGNGVAGGDGGKPPNYNGSAIYNNLCADIYAWGSNPGYFGRGSGIVLENGSKGHWDIYNNVFYNVPGFGFELDCNSSAGIQDVAFFNNLMVNTGTYCSGNYYHPIDILSAGSCGVLDKETTDEAKTRKSPRQFFFAGIGNRSPNAVM